MLSLSVCCFFAGSIGAIILTATGGGPGGYVAAIKAAQEGLKVRGAMPQFSCQNS
jgi:hypothetical protein